MNDYMRNKILGLYSYESGQESLTEEALQMVSNYSRLILKMFNLSKNIEPVLLWIFINTTSWPEETTAENQIQKYKHYVNLSIYYKKSISRFLEINLETVRSHIKAMKKAGLLISLNKSEKSWWRASLKHQRTSRYMLNPIVDIYHDFNNIREIRVIHSLRDNSFRTEIDLYNETRLKISEPTREYIEIESAEIFI